MTRRLDLPDLLLPPASLPYEVGATLNALICWPEDVVKFERLMPRLCHYAIRLMVDAEPGSGMRREEISVPKFKALLTTPAVVPFKMPAPSRHCCSYRS